MSVDCSYTDSGKEIFYFRQSFNPMCDSTDNWSCKFDESPEVMGSKSNLLSYKAAEHKSGVPCDEETTLTFAGSSSVAEDDYKATELKIKSFLDEKVRPFYSSWVRNQLNLDLRDLLNRKF